MASLLGKLGDAGVRPDGSALDEGPAYLWPECVEAWNVFLDLGSQWRDGGLGYADVLAHLRELYSDDEKRRDIYSCVRACERAVVAEKAKHRAMRAAAR